MAYVRKYKVAPLDEEHPYRDPGPGGDITTEQQPDEDECSDHAKSSAPR